MSELLRHHKGSMIFTIVTMLCGFAYGMYLFGDITKALSVVFIMGVLGVLEVSLSFDNAIVNSKVLTNMDEIWRKRFITWGMFFAVFVARFVIPLGIVSVAGNIGIFGALKLALNNQEKYAELLSSAHILIAGFGGAFLFLLACEYFFNEEKDTHWVKFIENRLVKLGSLESFSIVLTLSVVVIIGYLLPNREETLEFIMAGVVGVIIHESIGILRDLSNVDGLTTGAAKQGLIGFIYLEVLDLSYSMDSVIGALAVSNNIVIIAGGLAIGAMFVRSITIQLVESGTIAAYRYLEHGAFWSIMILACIMLSGVLIHIPEVITGLMSIVVIGLALYSSIKYNKNNPE